MIINFTCMNKHLLLAAALLLGCTAQAQTEQKPLVIEGYGEVYYGYDFNEPKSGDRQGNVVSHNRHNEVNLNLAMLKAMYNKDRVRANIGIMTGTYANANLAAEPGVLKNIYEANAGFRLHKRHELWIDAGVMPSHIGPEGAISMDCPTLTRSMIADASPYYEAGARLSYTTLNGKWYIALLHLNGWQRIQRQPGNSKPAGGMQVTYTPSDKILFNLSTFVGSDRPDAEESKRYFLDFYTVIKPAKELEITAAIDMGAEEYLVPNATFLTKDHWMGALLVVKYKMTQRSAIAARGEYFHDPANMVIPTYVPVIGVQTAAYSLGYDLQLMDNLLWRVEGKGYAAATPYFMRGNALFNDNYVLTTSLAVRFNNRKNH